MKKIVFALLMLPLFLSAEEKENKFGIGIGYRTHAAMSDDAHPVELNLQYRLKDRHTFSLEIPFWLKHQKYLHDPAYNSYVQSSNYIVGVGIGYDYGIPIKNNFYAFGGAGIEYLHAANNKITDMHYILEDGEEVDSYEKDKKRGNAYSLTPNVGLRYCYKHIQAEIKYTLHVSYMFGKEDMYQGDIHGTVYPDKLKEWNLNGGFAFSLSYLFNL